MSRPLAASTNNNAAGCAPVNGRSSSAQPSGVIHRSQPTPLEVSASTRSSKARPTIPPPSSSASRRVGASWLASAPTPANTAALERTEKDRAPPGDPRQHYLDPPRFLLIA